MTTTSASPIGLDKHPRGAFTEDPALVGMPSWYAENGQYLTTQFFGMKANRYLHEHNISQRTLAKVANKNFRNGAPEPERVPAQADQRGRHPQLDDAQLSADPVHVLRARRGCGRGGDVPRRHRPHATRTSRCISRRSRFAPGATVPTRSTPPAHRSTRTWRRRCTPRVPRSKEAGVAPEDVDVVQLQDTDAGAEIIHMAECGFCADGDQEKLLADGATEIGGDHCRSTPTAA